MNRHLNSLHNINIFEFSKNLCKHKIIDINYCDLKVVKNFLTLSSQFQDSSCFCDSNHCDFSLHRLVTLGKNRNNICPAIAKLSSPDENSKH